MVAKVFYWKPNHVANNIHKNEKNSCQIFIAKKDGCILSFTSLEFHKMCNLFLPKVANYATFQNIRKKKVHKFKLNFMAFKALISSKVLYTHHCIVIGGPILSSMGT
jgi:hypothetical protein